MQDHLQSQEELLQEVAPGRNRVIYLLGHLVAVNDRLLPLLGLGERLYPELDEAFLTNPDRAIGNLTDPSDLKIYWNNINGKLGEGFSGLTPEEWFQRHNSVSDEEFSREPHRNKLSVVISRTNHLASHLGQLTLVKHA